MHPGRLVAEGLALPEQQRTDPKFLAKANANDERNGPGRWDIEKTVLSRSLQGMTPVEEALGHLD